MNEEADTLKPIKDCEECDLPIVDARYMACDLCSEEFHEGCWDIVQFDHGEGECTGDAT